MGNTRRTSPAVKWGAHMRDKTAGIDIAQMLGRCRRAFAHLVT